MAFLIFERTDGNGGSGMLRPTGEHFRLAGYNLIYQAWETRDQPLAQGNCIISFFLPWGYVTFFRSMELRFLRVWRWAGLGGRAFSQMRHAISSGVALS